MTFSLYCSCRSKFGSRTTATSWRNTWKTSSSNNNNTWRNINDEHQTSTSTLSTISLHTPAAHHLRFHGPRWFQKVPTRLPWTLIHILLVVRVAHVVRAGPAFAVEGHPILFRRDAAILNHPIMHCGSLPIIHRENILILLRVTVMDVCISIGDNNLEV